jgi:enamine deaminase RidA (YjgF/YER057c/UK114 family)
MERRFSEPFPARATVEISKLPKGVEIEMDAILSIQA